MIPFPSSLDLEWRLVLVVVDDDDDSLWQKDLLGKTIVYEKKREEKIVS